MKNGMFLQAVIQKILKKNKKYLKQEVLCPAFSFEKENFYLKNSAFKICICKYNPDNYFKLNRKIFFENKKFIFFRTVPKQTLLLTNQYYYAISGNPSFANFQKLAECFENFLGYFRKDFRKQECLTGTDMKIICRCFRAFRKALFYFKSIYLLII